MTAADQASKKADKKPAKLTPMMQQFMEIKVANPGKLLFFRMGDFYELFFDDAVQAAAALNITLTKRGKHNGEDIPMCGVPVHAATDYLQKLSKAGFKVAIVDQLESPSEAKKRGPKSVVKRGVVRIVTAGTLTEDSLLNDRQNNHLVAIAPSPNSEGQDASFALAWVDISTGQFAAEMVALKNVASSLTRLEAKELIYSDQLHENELFANQELGLNHYLELWAESGLSLSQVNADYFDSIKGLDLLSEYFSFDDNVNFEQFDRCQISALASLYHYIDETQRGQMPVLKAPDQFALNANMLIDVATRNSLEILKTQNGDRKGSLLHSIDRTVSSAAARLMAARISSPLTNITEINQRLDLIDWFLTEQAIMDEFRSDLKSLPDMERALGRLSLGRGGPRDLLHIRIAFEKAILMHQIFTRSDHALWPRNLKSLLEQLMHAHCNLKDELQKLLKDEVPLKLSDGGFIQDGVLADLDEVRSLSKSGKQFILNLEAEYQAKTEIKNLRIKHNNMLGYFIEVTASNGDKMLNDFSEEFIHRQTMKNVVRFSSVELGELERKISSATSQIDEIEKREFERLSSLCQDYALQIGLLSNAIAELDVSAALALLARDENYCRPKIDDSQNFDIKGGRHLVVEQALKARNEPQFIANDCALDATAQTPDARIMLLTGPNMAGKSTYLRQNALIAILAQMGSFVPAQSAHIGVVDQLFSRVGAADDLARGRSTFMVEMVETATILNQASKNSLVILDEIGRGTATYDGLSIAWATIEHLHNQNCCRALFATHYHELTALKDQLHHLKNATMRVAEWQGEVKFLHEVKAGVAERSYGIHVAKLAGLPDMVIDRAASVLQHLEESENLQQNDKNMDQLPLFSYDANKPVVTDKVETELSDKIKDINADELSPRAALDLIYELKSMAK